MRSARDIDELEQIAVRLRRAANLENVFAFNVIDAVSRLETTFPGLKLVDVEDNRLPSAEAEANSATNTILVRRSTLQAAAEGRRRARFIVIEELCHIALGHTGPRHRNVVGHPTGYTHQERIDERDARCLAGLVLAPTALAVDCASAQELMDRFLLSNEAARIRWEELERHRRKISGERRKLPDGIIDFLKVQRSKGFKVTADLGDEE